MDTKIISKIDEIIKKFKDRDDYELEFKYDAEINKENFNKLIDFFKNEKLKKEETSTLDIIFEHNKIGYRITIDESQMPKYSSTNKITANMVKEFLIKQKITDYKPLQIKEYNLKLNLKEEKQVEDKELIKSILSVLDKTSKGFRYKERTSFILKKYRIDLTIVKNYNNANPKVFTSNKTFSINDILKQETYEIEIEALSKKITANEFSNIGIKIFELINEEESSEEQEESSDEESEEESSEEQEESSEEESDESEIKTKAEAESEEKKVNLKWMLPNRIGYQENIFKNFPPEKYQQTSDNSDKSLSLFPQQRLIRDFIQFDSPYKGALLYHELGSGKSGASIAAAEGYINKKKMFVLSPASLAVNYENEILKISSIGLNLKKDWQLVKIKTSKHPKSLEILEKKYAIKSNIIKKEALVWIPLYDDDIPEAVVIKTKAKNNEDKTAINLMISHIIRNRYKFISYNGLTNKNVKELGDSPFDNSFIIIDEVHNFASRIVNGSRLARDIYSKILNAVDCKVILLSGTPIINNPYEIATIINLIRGYMKVYELTYMKTSTKKISIQEFVAKMKEKGFLDIIDEFLIDNEKDIIYLSLLPKGYKKEEQSAIITKSSWGFNEEEAVKKIIAALNENKNVKINSKYGYSNYAALPNTINEFNSSFLDITDDENPTVKNMDLFMRRILGTVSYYSISGSDLFPRRLEDITKYLDMTDIQFKNYLEQRTVERKMDNAQKGKKGGLFDSKTSVYRAFSRMVCNFSFPEDIKRSYPNDIKKALKKELDDADDNEKDEIEDEKNSDNEEKDIKAKATDIYDIELKKAIKKLIRGDYLEYEEVKNHYSPKFAEMHDDIVDSPGSVLVYSQFRNVEGLGLFTEFLNNQGFIEVDIKKTDGEYYLTDPDVFDPEYDDKRYVVFNQDKEKTKFLMNLFNGDFKNLPSEVANAIPKGANQLYGNLIKVFCITASGAEGISLKNVRRVLITEPYWNNIRIEQVIGRAIRSKSHEDLPLKDRDVTVYRYIMKFTKKQIEKDYSIATLDKGITTDEHILFMANKKMDIVNQFLRMLKMSSFDCIIHAKQNKPIENDFKCFSWAIGAPKNDLSYTNDIKDDYKIMKHRAFQQQRKDRGRVVSKKGIKYVELNGKIYNYYSYTNAGILIPEEI